MFVYCIFYAGNRSSFQELSDSIGMVFLQSTILNKSDIESEKSTILSRNELGKHFDMSHFEIRNVLFR